MKCGDGKLHMDISKQKFLSDDKVAVDKDILAYSFSV